MSNWTDLTSAISDLRALLSDGPFDRYCYQKKVFGDVDGRNRSFKTFEFRRVTNFTSDPGRSPCGVYVEGSKIDFVKISDDDVMSGEFNFADGNQPGEGQKVTATYYYQWFIDDELAVFLKNATSWLGMGVDITSIPDGLQPAALHFAAQEAYQKQAIRWRTTSSDSYLLEDSPSDKAEMKVKDLEMLVTTMQKKAVELRDNYYERQGQSKAPLFRSISGKVQDMVPSK